MTAAQLLRALAPLRPAAEGDELVLAGPPPKPLRPLVAVLQTGVRAALTGRPWYAVGEDGRGLGPLADGALDPARPLPWAVWRLCVAGDRRWDMVPGWWRLDRPLVFGLPPKNMPRPHVTSARRCPHLPLARPATRRAV